MRLLVHDHYTAGAEPRDADEHEQAALHRALLAAIAVDVARLGWLDVTLSTPRSDFAAELAAAEVVLPLVPEHDDELLSVAQAVEAAGRRLIGPSAATLRLLADGMGQTLALGEAGLPVPMTWTMGFQQDGQLERIARGVGYPVVVKPLAGAGGRGALLVAGESDLPAALAALRAATVYDEFLLQQFRPGLAIGVALVRLDAAVTVLGAWGGLTERLPKLAITRCATPLDHPLLAEALAMARQAVLAIPDARGYLEARLILGETDITVLGVQSRPTLGLLALRHSLDLNLASLLVGTVEEGQLPAPSRWSLPRPAAVNLERPERIESPMGTGAWS